MIIQKAVHNLGLLGLCVLSACAPFGNQSPLSEPKVYSLSPGQTAQAHVQWWKELGNTQLNQLIEQALANSPDLQRAQARFQQAQAELGITRAMDMPQVGLGVKGIGEYVSHKPEIHGMDTSHTIRVVNATLQGSWVLDFWGKNRAQIASVLGKQQAIAYEAEQTRIELANAIATQYFAWQALVAEQQVLTQKMDNTMGMKKIIQQRVHANLLPVSAVYPIETEYQQMKAQQLQLTNNATRLRHSLAVLSGNVPNALDGQIPKPLSSTPVMKVDHIHADLLGYRPDIAAQRSLLESRTQAIKSAKAEFYPNIELKLLAGLSNINAFDLIKNSHSGTLGILPALNLPLFTSGALQSKLALRNAEYNDQVAIYNKVVLNAMRAAADAISDYQSLQGQSEVQQKATAIAEKTAGATLRRVNAGLDNKLAYFEKQDEALSLKMQLLQTQSAWLTAWSNLHAQLGGGFKVELK